MDVADIFDPNPLSLMLIICSGVALAYAFCTLKFYISPMKQYLTFARVVANARITWDFMEDREWALCGHPMREWSATLENLEVDVERHANVTLRPSGITQVLRIWSNTLELVYSTRKSIWIYDSMQKRYAALKEALDSPV
ncbi:hypothetical protein BDN70DRAFT_992899 [Pholiota conissans]|uniref:Uncharacterized protein n=1 Tax=Pholiota conissans TaxID=109636 RepID=A0A9P6D203_9AGAR|nr:hypothetical protein BDN70DRAFT_992899 [Pholiota conissans]